MTIRSVYVLILPLLEQSAPEWEIDNGRQLRREPVERARTNSGHGTRRMSLIRHPGTWDAGRRRPALFAGRFACIALVALLGLVFVPAATAVALPDDHALQRRIAGVIRRLVEAHGDPATLPAAPKPASPDTTKPKPDTTFGLRKAP